MKAKPRLRLHTVPPMPPVAERHPLALAMTEAMKRAGLLSLGQKLVDDQCEREVRGVVHRVVIALFECKTPPTPEALANAAITAIHSTKVVAHLDDDRAAYWAEARAVIAHATEHPEAYLSQPEPTPAAATEPPVPTPSVPPPAASSTLASRLRRGAARLALSLSNHLWALAGFLGGKDVGR